MSIHIKASTPFGSWTFRFSIAAGAALLTLGMASGCIPSFYRDNLDITSDCLDVSKSGYNFELTANCVAVRGKTDANWIVLVPANRVGNTQPKDAPNAIMHLPSQIIRIFNAGTKFRILKIIWHIDSNNMYSGNFLWTMEAELDSPDKFRCEISSETFFINPLRFDERFARPVKEAGEEKQ